MVDPLPEANPRRPAGRRKGDSGSKDAVLDAARDLFAELGFEGASMRAIAARAGVDPALIRHFFGDKDGLFVATMENRTQIPDRIAAALAGPPDSLGERAANTYLGLWEDPETQPILLSLVRSAMTSDKAAQLLVEAIAGRVYGASVSDAGELAKIRGMALAGSHLFGLAVARHIFHIPVLDEMTHDELVALVAPVIQQYLTHLE